MIWLYNGTLQSSIDFFRFFKTLEEGLNVFQETPGKAMYALHTRKMLSEIKGVLGFPNLLSTYGTLL